jgi:hypothetical protein
LSFDRRHSLLGHRIPAGELGLPCGRLTGPRAGPRRGYRVPHARAATGVGAPYTPRTAVLIPAEARAQPAPAARRRLVLAPLQHPTGGVSLYEASTGVHAIHPSGLPLACGPRVERAPSGFPPSFAPHRHRRRTSRAGTGHRARTSNNAHGISRTSNQRVHSYACDLASHRALRQRADGRRGRSHDLWPTRTGASSHVKRE